MKNISFSVFNVVSILAVFLLVILIVMPFNLINLEQAQRIAKWKSEFDQLNYCFSLVNLHEGAIIPTEIEAGKVLSEEYLFERIRPYFNFTNEKTKEVERYSYRKMNGGRMDRDSQFFFDRFFTGRGDLILSLRKSIKDSSNDKNPSFFMYVDINGLEKPNRVGQDIFFINIYKNHVNALGYGKEYVKLKSNCSPIGSGLYCGEYYLLGGRF